ncbi:MAG: ATP-dependent DNA helicase [Halobacteria archaeon]
MKIDHESMFPKEEAYPNQEDAMDHIETALDDGRDVVFEGACGTGKTLSALVPALDYAKKNDMTVVITTNVHQQMRQFIQESREIQELEDINVSVFKGKSSMCHIDAGYDECEALRDATYDTVELKGELKEIKQKKSLSAEVVQKQEAIQNRLDELQVCDYFHNNLVEDNSEFHGWLNGSVRTPDEVKEHAEDLGKCGYELLKENMENVDLVVCNYHHLLDPEIRRYFFKWLDAAPDEVIAVFDEAHNLEDAARQHSSKTVNKETLERAAVELAEQGEVAGELREAVEDFHQALEDTVRDELGFGEIQNLGEDWTDVTVQEDGDSSNSREDTTDDVLKAFREEGGYSEEETERLAEEGLKLAAKLDKEYERKYKAGETEARKECPSLAAFGFLRDYLKLSKDPQYYPVAGVKEGANGVKAKLELYACIPRGVTHSLFDGLHSSILMSATLRPFEVIETVLGLENPVELAYGLDFPEDNRETLVAGLPPLFSRKRDDPQTISRIQSFLEDVVEYSVGNVLLFFPSYSEAERYFDRCDVEAEKMLDRVGESAKEIRSSLDGDGKKVVFTYLWGTLTEGVDFPDDVARTAVVVGVGYPYLSERRRAVEDAYDTEFGDGWRYAIEAPTIRKTRQAMGRIIRSPDDFGVRILADSRYSPRAGMGKYQVTETFPDDEVEEFVDVEELKIKYALYNFWKTVDADVDGMEL